MARNLVIVESPAKAKTIGRYLGSNYSVKASLGHVRDLPKSQLGVDVERDFVPKYLVPKEKKDIVRELKEAAKKANAVYLATDPDREGEAISWHLVQAADIDAARVRRVVFHEITKEAIQEAFRHPRPIDDRLVAAQQARRILDRLVGYKISPLLWQKVRRGLSAGRVQSVTVRLIVDREREIQAFQPVEYWTIEAELAKQIAGALRARARKAQTFRAQLIGRFGEKEKLELPNQATADAVVADLRRADYAVAEVRRRDVQRNPAAPFITSTLQQEASRKLHFVAKRTMAVAQQLYEGLSIGKEGSVGLITYMRTDSTNVAASAQAEARAFIAEQFGADYVPEQPRVYARKVKGAQEAHEAIRPTSIRRTPDLVKPHLTPEQYRLYELIWKRFVASQMASAVLDTTSVDVRANRRANGTAYLLRASGSIVKFKGFLAVYVEGRDDEEEPDGQQRLPEMAADEPLDLVQLLPEQHFTQPPPRYTEATLVKALEEKGIGRPSTYAPTLSTIQDRGYVERADRRLKPTDLGMLVNDILTEHFGDIVDVDFTAQLEEELDEIASGERAWVPALREFYEPFIQSVETAQRRIPKVRVADESTGELCEKCGQPLVIKLGRFGKFIACSGFPACRNAKPLLVKIGVACPDCGGDLVQKKTRRGRVFYGCARYPTCEFTSWDRPLAQVCPGCGGLMVLAGKQQAKCRRCGQIAEAQLGEEVAVGA